MRNPDCRRCSLASTAHTVCVGGTGPSRARIMIVGEAPGEQEDRDGVPFVGAAGQILNDALAEAGLSRDEVYVTNIVRCRPPYNREPHVGEVNACFSYLLEEIESVHPEVIVPLGNSALKALTGKTGITKERGKLQTPRKGLYTNAKILPTIHPAAVLRPEGRDYYAVIVEDLRLVSGMSRPQPAGDTVRIITPTTPVLEALLALAPLARARHLSADTEWTAQEPIVWPWSKRGELLSLSLSAHVDGGSHNVAIAWPPAPAVRETIVQLLSSHKVIFHNAMADMMWMRDEDIPVDLAGDTMLLAYLLDERQRLNLEAVATRFAPERIQPGWKGVYYNHRPDDEDEWKRLLSYNAEDTRATLYAFDGLAQEIARLPIERADQIRRVHKHLLMPAVRTLMGAAYHGVPIDEPRLAEEERRAVERRHLAAEALADIAGCTPVQAARLALSPEKAKVYLHKAYGLEVEDSTKDTLSLLAGDFPAVAAILAYRKQNKLLSTYLRPWRVMLQQQGDGRLHTIYRITGTRTGRLSAEVEYGASLQVAPRDTEDVAFRSLVKAEPGYVILSADYSQLELRVIAWLANEPTMRRFYTEGIDLHYATAAFLVASRSGPISMEAFWADRDRWIAKVTKQQRQAAKGTNFGLAYGQGDDGFREYTRVNFGVTLSPHEAMQARAGYFRLYSRLPGWQDRSMFEAEERGYTETPFGRRRKFDPGDVHAAINTPIQSTASDLTLLAMTATDARYAAEGLDATIIGFVHDSIIVHVAKADAEKADRILCWEMEHVDTSPFGFEVPVPMVAESKTSEVWA